MTYEPGIHHRRSIRLRRYDYSQAGAYYVTISPQDRAFLFGDVVNGDMRMNDAGRIASDVWNDLPHHYPHFELDAFIVMPNHVHGIIVIIDAGAGKPRPYGPTLGQIVAYLKCQSTKRINALRATLGAPVWQRNYYEPVVRNESEMDRIRKYIADNPASWETDRDRPDEPWLM